MSSSPAAPTASAKLDPALIRTTVAIIVGVIAVIFDSTIVSVALHQLSIDLHASIATIQWVSTGYLLALGISIPLVGWLQGRLGSKRLWMIALTVFLLGSVLCSFAWDAPSLIVFRIVQGLGGGAMLPLLTTIIVQAAGGAANLGKLMAVAALPTALGPIIGPTLGGVILNFGDWRWLFLVNVPLCLVGLFLAWRLMPKVTTSTRVKLDIVGFLLLSPGLVALLWGFSNVSGDGGFGRLDVVIPLIAGALLIGAFVVWALRRADAALVDLRVLGHRATWSATALMFLMGASLYGAMLLLPLYWQELRGADALGAGLLLISQGVGSLLSRTFAPRVMGWIGARATVIVGFAIAGLATVPFAFADASTSIVWLEIVLLLRGFGLSLVLIPLMSLAFIGLGREEVPHASIVTRVAQQIGASIGVAVLAVILTTTATSAGSLATGFQIAFWVAIGFAVLAIAVALVLPGRRALTQKPETPTERDASEALLVEEA
ncbi:MAG: MDR family MFS transporter [Pseudolysinimonas sp.]